MGLGNIVSTILTKYKADTKDQKAAIKKLSGEEKKRHKALLEQTEAQNKKLDGHIAMWGKVAVGIGAVAVAATALNAGLDTLQKNARLNAATVGVELDGLRASTIGLVDDTRLLEFASKAMNGTFKLSQIEMEQALQGALALRKTLGVDLPTALERTQQAITEGSTEPLKQLGIVVKGPENDTEAGLQAALEALNAEAESLGGNFGIAGDDIERAGTQLENATDSIMESLGQVAIALAPAIEAMADLVTWTLKAQDALTSFLAGAETQSAVAQARAAVADSQAAVRFQEREASGELGFIDSLITGGGSDAALERAKAKLSARQADLTRLLIEEDDKRFFAQNRADQERFAAKRRADAAAKADRDRLSPEGAFDISGSVVRPGDRAENILGSSFEDLARSRTGRLDLRAETAASERRLAEFREFSVDVDAALETLNANIAEFDRLTRGTNMLEMVFGTSAEINATAAALSQLTAGFDGLTNAFGAGVDALITGSGSFADAFTDAIGQTLRGMAVEMSMQALRHAAFGIGAFAFGNIPSAIAHGKAAAGFAAGAIATGVAASQFGVNTTAQSTPSIGSSRSVGAAGVGRALPGAQDDNQGSTQLFFLDDEFTSMSSRERESRFRTRARSSGVEVPGDVVING